MAERVSKAKLKRLKQVARVQRLDSELTTERDQHKSAEKNLKSQDYTLPHKCIIYYEHCTVVYKLRVYSISGNSVKVS